ncbi:MAG TPA: 2-dehydropantoate 2-reductase [Catalimonadaceae bacterium]|nr:2-dehydropantoate 2-reductase [Catalimonadaceae bacterium]
MKKSRILFAGMGGVGGYFGGVMANHFQQHSGPEIAFLARGEHLKAIREKGLTVRKGAVEFQAHPAAASDDGTELGLMDFVFVCCKSYDLEKMAAVIKPCLKPDTIVISLLNGTDGPEKLERFLPGTTIAPGCVFIYAQRLEPGVIENSGPVETMFFGLKGEANERLRPLENWLQQSGIKALASPQIETLVWEKFIFISPIATATSYYRQTIGEIRSDPEKWTVLNQLLAEVVAVAAAKQIDVDPEIVAKTLYKYEKSPADSTSSMYRDFESHPDRTEVESLTHYVIREGERLGIGVAEYQMVVSGLL